MATKTTVEPRTWTMCKPTGELVEVATMEAAVLAHVESGAVPVDLNTWPWPAMLAPVPSDAVVAKLICPTTGACFPNGIDPAWSSVTCVHGTYDLG